MLFGWIVACALTNIANLFADISPRRSLADMASSMSPGITSGAASGHKIQINAADGSVISNPIQFRGSTRRIQPVKSFTLIEMLVVVAIIGTLAGLLLPVIGSAREKARRVACASNLRQIGMLISQYASDYSYSPVPYKINAAGDAWSNQSFSNLQNYAAAPTFFHCPSDSRIPSKPVTDWASFTSSTNACSYSLGRNLRWGGFCKTNAIVMDRVGTGQGIYQAGNPLTGQLTYFLASPLSFNLLNPTNGTAGAVWTNGNHRSAGGNFLFADGRVTFCAALPVDIVDYKSPSSTNWPGLISTPTITVQNPL